MTVEVGDKIKLLNENGNYDKWEDKTWTVSSVEYSGGGYDEGLSGQGLISCKGLPVSVYEYEIEVVG